MIGKPVVLKAALSIIISLFFMTTQAQPLLPDMAGITDKGVNILTWTCQYSGIKSIAVQRSSDSLMNFTTVGYVRNLQKGVQVFADGHPQPGNNYYELVIVFSSDLSWTSNRIKMYVDSSVIKYRRVRLPSNDSLQKYLTTSTKSDVKTDKTTQKDVEVAKTTDSIIQARTGNVNVAQGITVPDEVTPYSPYGSIGAHKKKTVIVVGTKDEGVITTLDSSVFKVVAKNDSLVKKQPKITISLVTDATELNPYNYIKSEYVFTDDVSGNINITLPDVKSHAYSMKVFNTKNNMIMDIPKFSASPIIMDKRNFHQGGLYKFILKRDNKEFETGFVAVSLDE